MFIERSSRPGLTVPYHTMKLKKLKRLLNKGGLFFSHKLANVFGKSVPIDILVGKMFKKTQKVKKLPRRKIIPTVN